MDIFKFRNPTAKTKLEQGEILDGFRSKMWVERYRAAGEFQLVAEANSDLRLKLALGTLISHTETSEVMVVENHEISDDKNSDPKLVITGRGLETYLENRIVGSNVAFPSSATPAPYSLASAKTYDQAVTMINAHIQAASLVDVNNAIPYTTVMALATGAATTIDRTVDRGDLYTRTMELLAIDDLGMKVIRPGIWSPVYGGPNAANTVFAIHKGVDRSQQIVFSYDTGEIESADYLWSIKRLKTAALVVSTWVQAFVTTGETQYDRRVMYIDARSVDSSYTTTPTAAQINAIRTVLERIGNEELMSQNEVALTKAEVSKNASKSKYRVDFDVGDLIMVSGDYNETSVMRVSEYVEIEDETGSSAYPTLSTV